MSMVKTQKDFNALYDMLKTYYRGGFVFINNVYANVDDIAELLTKISMGLVNVKSITQKGEYQLFIHTEG